MWFSIKKSKLLSTSVVRAVFLWQMFGLCQFRVWFSYPGRLVSAKEQRRSFLFLNFEKYSHSSVRLSIKSVCACVVHQLCFYLGPLVVCIGAPSSHSTTHYTGLTKISNGYLHSFISLFTLRGTLKNLSLWLLILLCFSSNCRLLKACP